MKILTSTPKLESESLVKGFVSHNGKLLNYANSRTHNRAMSEDMVQETFLKTWRFIVRGGDIKIMEAFLYHVLNALIVDEYRKRKTVSLEVLLERGFEPGLDTRERLINTLDGKRALNLIDDLPVHYRRVMRMRFEQDLSLTEISLLTGESKNTVAVQVHRGLAKLRALYRHD